MRRASLLSLLVGITLVILKAVAWSFTDSLSILTSLVDSMLDVMASTLNFVAVRYALQPPDREHRFGHGKAEDLATLAQSTFICGSGVFLIIEGIKRLFNPVEIYNSYMGMMVMIISIIFSLSLVIYQRSVVRRTLSGAIAADALHYFTDFLTNVGVILALFLTTNGGWKIADPVIALIIAAAILYGAYAMSSKALQNLLDREFSDEERQEIKRIVRAQPDVLGLHDLRTRKSGINAFIQFHLDLNPHISLKRAHEISDQVEDTLKAAFPQADIIIHQDPLHEGREGRG